MTSGRKLGLWAAVALAAMGIATGSAAATTTGVVATITAQNKVLDHASDSKVYDALFGTSVSSFTLVTDRRLVIALAQFHAKIDHAATVVSRASVATMAERQGRREWVAGTRMFATGIWQLRGAFVDALRDHGPAALAAAHRSHRTLEAGKALITRANKLLGIPVDG